MRSLADLLFERDRDEAEHWYREAAARGSRTALEEPADKLVDQDRSAAEHWYE